MAGIEIVPGAIIGVAFQQVWNAIKELNTSHNHFNPTLRWLGKHDQVVLLLICEVFPNTHCSKLTKRIWPSHVSICAWPIFWPLDES